MAEIPTSNDQSLPVLLRETVEWLANHVGCVSMIDWDMHSNRILSAATQLESGHETTAGVSAEEFDRYRRCLYRANGRLIQLGREPEKLDYPQAKVADEPNYNILPWHISKPVPDCQCHGCSGLKATPDAYKATCEGGSGGPCTQPDCEKCWPDEELVEHLYVPRSSGNDQCMACGKPKSDCSAVNGSLPQQEKNDGI